MTDESGVTGVNCTATDNQTKMTKETQNNQTQSGHGKKNIYKNSSKNSG